MKKAEYNKFMQTSVMPSTTKRLIQKQLPRIDMKQMPLNFVIPATNKNLIQPSSINEFTITSSEKVTNINSQHFDTKLQVRPQQKK